MSKFKFIKTFFKKAVVITAILALCITSGVWFPGKADAAVRLNRRSVKLVPAKTYRLRLRGARAKAVRWRSSNRRKVTVSKSGLIRGKARGKAVVTATYRGRRYRCRVTVVLNKKSAGSSSGSGSTGNSTKNSGSSKNSSSKNNNSKNGNSKNNNSKNSRSTGNSSENSGKSTSGSGKSSENSSVEISGTAVHSLPANPAENTLAVGAMTVALDEDINTVKQRLGQEVRSCKEPQGFTSYEYNPGGDYSNLLFVYEDGGKVVGMSTISPYANYAGIVHSGEAAADMKSGSGTTAADSDFASRFKKDSTYDNATEYFTETGNAVVEAYAGVVAIVGNTSVFGIRVYKNTYNRSKMHLASSNEYDKNLTAVSYNGSSLYVSSGLSWEVCELLSAYRVTQGKTPLQGELVDTIGLDMAEKIAASGSDSMSKEEGESIWEKLIEAQNGEAGVESNARVIYSKSFSCDPMGVATAFTQYDESKGGSGSILVNGEFDRVTAGFAVNSSSPSETYAAVYLYKLRRGLLDD